MDDPSLLVSLLVAAGCGAIVGLERQVRPDAGSGARTFALYALWGAASAFAGERFGALAFLAGLLALAGIETARYLVEVQSSGDFGITTEIASFVTFGIGFLAFDEQFVVAIALSVGLAALLRSKEWVHRLIDRFSDDDVVAFLQFAVITAIVLPLAPSTEFGPFEAFNPRQIWLMVVFVSGIGLLGYLALRVMGRRGLGLSGVVGGLVSSTAVTLGFSRMSKSFKGLNTALVAGVIGASGLMYPRVLVEAWVVARALGARLLIPLLAIGAVVIGVAIVFLRREQAGDDGAEPLPVKNPLNLATALQFGLLYAGIIFVSKAVLDTFSEGSILLVAGLSGINDVDAITLSTANLVKGGGLSESVGAQAVLLAVAVNTLVKAGIAVAVGSKQLAKIVAVTLVPAAAAAVVAMFFV